MNEKLLTDVLKAYYDARENKRNTYSQLRFEMNLEENLMELYHESKNAATAWAAAYVSLPTYR